MRKLWLSVTIGLALFVAAPVAPLADAAQRPRIHYGAWSMFIPRIGVNAPVIGLDADHSGYAPVPSLSAAGNIGWWRFSARPGSPGNAVFVGHVDTYLGPAVFYNLYQLRPGDMVYVLTPPFPAIRYRVRWVKELPKGRLATDTILGTTRLHRAWLITCGGPFNYSTRSYEDNIIVSAEQVR